MQMHISFRKLEFQSLSSSRLSSFNIFSPLFIIRSLHLCLNLYSLCLISIHIQSSFNMKGANSKSKSDNKLAVKKGGAAKGGKKPAKKEKAVKDPNMPKRPASAFFVFMEEFRQTYKEKHPNNKSVSVVGKAGGAKWKSLSDAEKAPYVAKADKRKVDYEKDLKAYKKKQAEGTKEDDSEKSESEVHDDEDDNEEDGSGEDEDDE